MSKLSEALQSYEKARERVLDLQRVVAGQRDQIAHLQRVLSESERDLENAKRALRAAADKVPSLVHADVSGICGAAPSNGEASQREEPA